MPQQSELRRACVLKFIGHDKPVGVLDELESARLGFEEAERELQHERIVDRTAFSKKRLVRGRQTLEELVVQVFRHWRALMLVADSEPEPIERKRQLGKRNCPRIRSWSGALGSDRETEL